MLFDEIALEDEGFELAVYDDGFEIGDAADEAGDPAGVFGAGDEVAPDAVAEVDGLADIEDIAFGGAIDVAAGLFGEGFELVLDQRGEGSLWSGHTLF